MQKNSFRKKELVNVITVINSLSHKRMCLHEAGPCSSFQETRLSPFLKHAVQPVIQREDKKVSENRYELQHLYKEGFCCQV